MRITSRGQVTIPAAIRHEMGLLPETEVEVVISRGKVVLRKRSGRGSRCRTLVDAMRGKANKKMTTDQIMALIRGK